MIKEAIAMAATRDEAIEKAKAALNAPIDADVKFEILQDAQKKMLGIFGGKDAKVRAYYEAPDAPRATQAPVKEAPQRAAAPAPKRAADPKPAPKKEDIIPITAEDDAAIKKYLGAIIHGMGMTDAVITSKDEEEETVYEIETAENHGALIGRHGETLDSVQYLVRLFANKNTTGNKKVSINIGDYRQKRSDNLKSLAARSASQVLKYGRSAKLEPMNPYERRIVHTAIQEIAGVTSHSVGFDSERRVVITLEEGVQPTHGDRRKNTNNRGGYNNNRGGNRNGGNRGGYNNNNRGGYNNRDGNRGGGRREPYKPSTPPDRAPKSDVTTGARYGIIEVKKNDSEE